MTKVAAGGYHSLVVCEDDLEMFGFGSGKFGQNGHGNFFDSAQPKRVTFPHNNLKQLISKVEAGGRHCLVLMNTGRLYAFGYGAHG